jgi:hypothetical protein
VSSHPKRLFYNGLGEPLAHDLQAGTNFATGIISPSHIVRAFALRALVAPANQNHQKLELERAVQSELQKSNRQRIALAKQTKRLATALQYVGAGKTRLGGIHGCW